MEVLRLLSFNQTAQVDGPLKKSLMTIYIVHGCDLLTKQLNSGIIKQMIFLNNPV